MTHPGRRLQAFWLIFSSVGFHDRPVNYAGGGTVGEYVQLNHHGKLKTAENNGSIFDTLRPTLNPRLSAPVRCSAVLASAVGDDRREWNRKDFHARCAVSFGLIRAGKTEFGDFGLVGSGKRTHVRQGRRTRAWNRDGSSRSR